MKTDKKVMAIILNYNSAEDSMKCASLLKEQEYENLIITIIDNKSTDDSEKRLIDFCDSNNIVFRQSGSNAGFSSGNNVGLKMATELGCEYSLIINPDVEIRDRNYVKKAVEKLEHDEKIAVMGSDVINAENYHQNPLRELNFFENTFWPVMLVVLKLAKKDIYVGDYKKSGYVHKVSGCCFFIRMSFARNIGYLDDTVFMYCEEPILATQVKNAGYKEYYYSEIKAYHMHKNLGHGASAESLERFYDSRIYYIRKYRYKGIIRAIVTKSISLQKRFMIKRVKKRGIKEDGTRKDT